MFLLEQRQSVQFEGKVRQTSPTPAVGGVAGVTWQPWSDPWLSQDHPSLFVLSGCNAGSAIPHPLLGDICYPVLKTLHAGISRASHISAALLHHIGRKYGIKFNLSLLC